MESFPSHKHTGVLVGEAPVTSIAAVRSGVMCHREAMWSPSPLGQTCQAGLELDSTTGKPVQVQSYGCSVAPMLPFDWYLLRNGERKTCQW